MATPLDALDLKAVADEVLASLGNHRQIPTFSSRPGGLRLDQAYQVTALLRARFEARGEKIVGRKIGFTNREMWKVYGVQSPIWGYVTDRTIHELADKMPLRDFSEPRIEPEIMFGLKAAPTPDMDEAALLDCIEWVSLGYEIVQSIFPGWKFTAADTVAANGVHGRFSWGRAMQLRRAKQSGGANWQLLKSSCVAIERLCSGAVALSYSTARCARCATWLNCSLRIYTTRRFARAKLFLAMPVSPGEIWTTNVFGLPLNTIALQFE